MKEKISRTQPSKESMKFVKDSLLNQFKFKFRLTGHNRRGSQVEWDNTDTPSHNAPNGTPCNSKVGILNNSVETSVEFTEETITGGSATANATCTTCGNDSIVLSYKGEFTLTP